MKQYFDIFNDPIKPRVFTKKMGAPQKYAPQYDEDGKRIPTAVLSYRKRGFIVSKINFLIKKHGFDKIQPAVFKTKTEDELLLILTRLQMEAITIKNMDFLNQSKSISTLNTNNIPQKV